jgi:hypothetical protein
MVENIRENGLITTWRVWVYILGLMVEDMRVNIKMIKNMVMVFIHGPTKEDTKECGSEVNNMVLVYIQCQTMKLRMDYGKMGNVLNGLMLPNHKEYCKGK